MGRHHAPRSTVEVARAFDLIAEGFDPTRGRPWPEVDLIDSSPVLDLGCGNARHARVLEERGLEVVCADISIGMLEIAGRRFRGERVQCDAVSLPFRDSSFGSVLYLATLHHIPSEELRLRSLKEVRRVLKEGGKAVISVWALFQPRFLPRIPEMVWNVLRGWEFGDISVPWRSRRLGRVDRFYHLFTKGELIRLVRSAGFSQLEYRKSSFRSRFFAENHVVIARK